MPVRFASALGILLAAAAFAPSHVSAQQAPERRFAAAEAAARPVGLPAALEASPGVHPAVTRSPWKYPLIGAVAGGALGAVFSYGVHRSGGGDYVGPEAYVAWTLGGAAIGAGVGFVVDRATR